MSALLLGLFILILTVSMIPLGIVLIVKSRKPGSKFPTCGKCGYDLTGSTAATELCPECGGQFTEVGIIPPRPGGKKRLMVIGIVLLLVPLTCLGLMTLGIASTSLSAQRARQQAIAAQQQALTLSLTNDQQQLVNELAALSAQLESITDDAKRNELEAAILKLQQELESVGAEIKAVSPEPVGDGNSDEPTKTPDS